MKKKGKGEESGITRGKGGKKKMERKKTRKEKKSKRRTMGIISGGEKEKHQKEVEERKIYLKWIEGRKPIRIRSLTVLFRRGETKIIERWDWEGTRRERQIT